jgi:hypothetical protein
VNFIKFKLLSYYIGFKIFFGCLMKMKADLREVRTFLVRDLWGWAFGEGGSSRL